MGKSREVQDFLAGFTAGFKMMDDSIYKQALSEYYRGGGKGGRQNRYGLSGSSGSKEPNFFQRLFGGEEEKKFANPAEQGLDFLRQQRVQAVSEGNVAALKKIDADILDHAKIHGLGTPSTGNAKTGVPTAPKAPATNDPAPPTKTYTAPPPRTNIMPDAGNPVTDVDGGDGGDETADRSSIAQPDAAIEPTAISVDDEFPIEPMFSEGGFVDDEFSDTSIDDADADYTVTKRMAEAASPGIDAGLRLMQTRFAPQVGIEDADGGVSSGAEALARNEGAASDEEVQAIDAVIDPEGKLPASAKSAARIAAVTDFYKDDPEKAAELANRLLLHDKRNAQTRGTLAMQSIQQGDLKNALRLIQDAHNNDVPSGGLIEKAVLRDDGNADVVLRTADGPQTITATPQMIQQVAAETANGKAWVDQTIRDAGRTKQVLAKPKGANATALPTELTTEYYEARNNLQQALDGGDPEMVRAARARFLAAQNSAARFAAQNPNAKKILNSAGINLGTAPRAPAQPRQAATSKEERAEAKAQADREGLDRRYAGYVDNARSAVQAGLALDDKGNITGQSMQPTSTGMRSEAASAEAARRTTGPAMGRMSRLYSEDRSALGYDQADVDTNYTKQTFADRTEGLFENIEGLVANKSKDLKRPIMDKVEIRDFVRTADRIRARNNVDDGQIVEFLWGAKNDLSKPIQFDNKTGQVIFGKTKLFVDRDTIREIATARGEKGRRAEGMVEGMTAKEIEDYKQSSKKQRAADERSEAIRGGLKQGVDVDVSSTARGATLPEGTARERFSGQKAGAAKVRSGVAAREGLRNTINEDRARQGIPELGVPREVGPNASQIPSFLRLREAQPGYRFSDSENEREEAKKRNRRRWDVPTVRGK